MKSAEWLPITEGLHVSLGEARDALVSIIRGEADAIVVYGPRGEQVFTLRDAQQPYRVMVEAMNEGAATVTATGVILYANASLARILEAPLENVIGTDLAGWAGEADRAAFNALIEQGLRRPARRELSLRSAAGHEIPVYVSVSATESDGTRSVCLVATDLSQQRRAERDILESITEAFCSFDQEFRCTYANSEAERLFGRRREELIGAAPWNRFDVLGSGLEEPFRRTMAERTPAVFEHYRPEADRWHEIKLCPAGGGGVTEACRDITAHKRAEQQLLTLNQELERRVRLRTAELQNANRELEAFAYSVSHDLRAPLRAIRGFADALSAGQAGRLDETGRKYLDRICKGAAGMSRLIEGLLELARTARAPLDLRDLDLSALVAELARDLQGADPNRRIEFIIAPGLTARGDPALVRDALDNLLQNAWKFTSRTPAARIELGACGGAVYFVRDNGVGFDMAYAARLFAPFQRLHRQTDFPGAGLGLAMVQRIVARHGGRIWAESAPGQGATFSFTLAADLDVPHPA